MKKLMLICVFLAGITATGFSQKIIDEKIETGGKETALEFKFADDIILEAWDKSFIELHVEVNIDDNQYNDYYNLNIEKDGSGIKVIEEIDFEEIKKLKGNNKFCNFNTNVNYSLKVPKELTVKLETISGEVEIIGCEGEMNIKSISGFIDYAIPEGHDAKIKLSTVTGDVYSNVKFDESLAKKISWVGTKEVLSLKGGNTGINLETVSGDIYLRKY